MSGNGRGGRARRTPSQEALGAAARFASRAARDGLAELSYDVADSPLGELLLVRSRDGLLRVDFLDGSPDAVLDELARALSPSIVAAAAALDPWRRELDEYFSGTRTRFEAPLDWRTITGFQRRVLRATAKIPAGASASYAEVAAAAGNPAAARAAGNALGANPLPILIPCHRVRRSGGALGGYTGGLDRKRALLAIEAGGATR